MKKKRISEKNKFIFLCLFIFIFFTSLYYSFGVRLLSQEWTTETFDYFFDADVPRIICDFARYDCSHPRTKVHPIYVLLVNWGEVNCYY